MLTCNQVPGTPTIPQERGHEQAQIYHQPNLDYSESLLFVLHTIIIMILHDLQVTYCVTGNSYNNKLGVILYQINLRSAFSDLLDSIYDTKQDIPFTSPYGQAP